MKDLPTDIGTFSTIIENDYLYVDKTKYIYEMIKPGKKYFLSRPRRFGKSLLISTLEEVFQGNKKLFKNLYIHDKWDWNQTYPVIHVDLGNGEYESINDMKYSLEDIINRIARKFCVNTYSKQLSGKFADLIEEIYKKSGKVVILIDEYDKPIMDNIEDLMLADQIRKVLNSFYNVLKSSDEYIEFIFITGVTKFSKTSIFSGLNNLTDLTLDCPLICGYSQKELETYFDERINELASENSITKEYLLDIIKQWYNGYSYNGKDFLYNPYSILLLFAKKKFNNYWFETGTPTFLMKFIKNHVFDVSVLLNPNQVISGSFPDFDIKNLDFTTVLLQTGYLTVKREDYMVGELPKYTLGIPNREVDNSLYTHILSYYTKQSVGNLPSLAENMLNDIIRLDNNALQKSFDILFSNIPCSIYKNVKEEIREANYQMMFLSWMKILGLEIQGEISTSKGRMDALLKKNDLVVVIEIKYSLVKSLDKMIHEAMTQITDKEYYKPYIDKNVILLGVAIKDRDISCKLKD
ncbi:MAG: ATP-binding protein [Methanobrevibacter sp.]|jgi:hypothetical protein|nr:ATP-binding protein [Candidatus Methanovirga procula]